MNREIFFRGKRVDNGEWVYGYYVYEEWSRRHYITEKLIYVYQLIEVIPETVGQYTGLKDKNGKKIFEGDKVMRDYEWTKPTEIGVVTWNKDNASFQIKGHIPSSSMKHLSRMKVIGTIFDKEGNDEKNNK